MKKIMQGIVVLVLVLGMMVPCLQASAAEESTKKVNYVAIGDSITFGYGLPDVSTGFVPQVGQALNAVTTNLAINGLTSEGLLEELRKEEMKNVLSQADIISVSIGSNDLLRPFSELMMGILGPLMQNPSSVTDLELVLEKMNELTVALNSEETVTMFQGQIAQFEKNWAELLEQLKEIAPNAKLLVNDLYNPYVGTTIIGVPLGTYAEKYIPSMNQILQKNTDKGYTLIPVYQAFQQKGLTNVNVSKLNYDPHPNQLGHDTIANLVKFALGLPSSNANSKATLQGKKVKTVLNGKTSIFEQKTLCVNNRHYMVSADEFTKAIGAKMSVDMTKQTVTFTKSGKKLVVTLNEKHAAVNGKAVNLSTKVSMHGAHILVPVEGFTKAFGGSYKYDAKTNTLRVQVK